jgi:hypothetical protein
VGDERGLACPRHADDEPVRLRACRELPQRGQFRLAVEQVRRPRGDLRHRGVVDRAAFAGQALAVGAENIPPPWSIGEPFDRRDRRQRDGRVARAGVVLGDDAHDHVIGGHDDRAGNT